VVKTHVRATFRQAMSCVAATAVCDNIS